jgi:chemotaxis protein methyltransferase WspC
MTECATIERLVRQTIGFDVESIGRGAFEMTVRSARSCAGDCNACVGELRESPDALETLIEQMVVPETWFFRDREPFVLLVEAMRQRRRDGRALRILSVPCSTGEEPYSIAMALVDSGFEPGSFAIDAVDISRHALAAARRAQYGPSSFRGERRDRHFTAGCGGFQVDERVTQAVKLHHGNVCHPGFLAAEKPYDAIFCRNLLIYLVPEARRIVLGHLERLLSPEGILFTGHAEMGVFLEAGYTSVPHPGSFACQRGRRRVANKPERRPARPVKRAHVRTPAGEDLLGRARALADRGELEQASELCNRILRCDRASAEAHYLKGLIEHACGRVDQAEEWLRKALYLEPGHYEALIQMSVLADSRGDTERSSLFMERARRAGAKREEERG